MSQNLHFCKLKAFDEQLVKTRKFKSIVKMLVVLLEDGDFEKDESLQQLLFEDIEDDLPIINSDEESLKPLLEGKPETLLHKNTRYYLVSDELWQCIQDIVLQDSEKNNKEKLKKYYKSLGILEYFQKKHLLVIDVS